MKMWNLIMSVSYRGLLEEANKKQIKKEEVQEISYDENLNCYILIYYR